MTDNRGQARGEAPEVTDEVAQARASAASPILGGAAIGTSVAGVILCLYAALVARPIGRVGVGMGPVSEFFWIGCGVAAFVAVMTVLLILGSERVGPLVSIVAVLLVGAGIWLFVVRPRAVSYPGLALSEGPGGRAPLAWLAAGWVALAVGILLLIVVRRRAGGDRRDWWRIRRGQIGAVGPVVVAVLVAGIAAAATPPNLGPGSGAAARIAAVPTELGSEVSYTVAGAEYLLVAGAGFVTWSIGDPAAADRGGAVSKHRAYEGATGRLLWEFDSQESPWKCGALPTTTGPGAGAMLVFTCTAVARNWPANTWSAAAAVPILIGLDALTGAVRWTNADGWLRAGQVRSPADLIAVRRGDELGALDPQTGVVRWSHRLTAPCLTDPVLQPESSVAIGAGIVWANPCGGVSIFAAADGAETRVATPVSGSQPGAYQDGYLVAAGGTRVLVRAYPGSYTDGDARYFVVDGSTGTAQALPADLRTFGSSVNPAWSADSAVQLSPRGSSSSNIRVLNLLTGEFVRLDGVTAGSVAPVASELGGWAVVGDTLVSAQAAAAKDGEPYPLLLVAPDGSVQRRPSPCPGAKVFPVPGAVVFQCWSGGIVKGVVG
ncbi:MAG: PQQ-binding-like beta-propeller repeat protein [Gordonia sp. (in: high G+C Gram-positive bacteria)]|uniref:outer membrane protein assembly factor BamB family protein n=1 Tax=Gordonia sp. (in: high G+C Gram-positive bacteria) TaxID=84139 RepID=UPI003BB6A86D